MQTRHLRVRLLFIDDAFYRTLVPSVEWYACLQHIGYLFPSQWNDCLTLFNVPFSNVTLLEKHKNHYDDICGFGEFCAFCVLRVFVLMYRLTIRHSIITFFTLEFFSNADKSQKCGQVSDFEWYFWIKLKLQLMTQSNNKKWKHNRNW